MMKEKRKHATLLMRELNFTEDDLAANQQGKLSDRQQQRLARQRLGIILGGLFITGIMLLFCYSGVYMLFALGLHRDGMIGIALPLCMFAFAGLAAPFGFLVLREGWNYDVAVQEGKLTYIQGVLQKQLRFFEKGWVTYYVKVGDTGFRVNNGVYQAFEEGQLYHVYYMSKTKTFLSAEIVQDEA
jgi:hypothetical protein